MTMEPTATRARTQGDKGQPFRPQRNARFERVARMQTPAASRPRARTLAHAVPNIWHMQSPPRFSIYGYIHMV